MRAAALLAVAAVLALAAAPVAWATPTPTAIDAMGDSITQAFDACALGDCPAGSWSTGSVPSVNSLARRLQAMNASLRINNDAKSGAQMDDLDRQAALAVAHGADFVTILMGANDACTSTTGQMTSAATYRSELDLALGILRTGLPTARILMLSVPDVEHLWRAFRSDQHARTAWSTFNICQSMLASPESDAPAAQSRRAAVSARIDAYNAHLAAACAGLNDTAMPDRCTWDNGTLHRVRFTPEQVSPVDFFHPSLKGQGDLAAVAWLGMGFVDTVAPDTAFATPPRDGGRADTTAAFSADEDASFQCRLDGGDWKACASRVAYAYLEGGRHELGVRAVDRAGNVDPTPAVASWTVTAQPDWTAPQIVLPPRFVPPVTAPPAPVAKKPAAKPAKKHKASKKPARKRSRANRRTAR